MTCEWKPSVCQQKNESGSRKSDNFYRFHEAMRHIIDECEEFY